VFIFLEITSRTERIKHALMIESASGGHYVRHNQIRSIAHSRPSSSVGDGGVVGGVWQLWAGKSKESRPEGDALQRKCPVSVGGGRPRSCRRRRRGPLAPLACLIDDGHYFVLL
jgi:hypothetical protein